ncbi:hypothetical protein OUZ56_021509 [Daphnia magna]|uniref:Uncharacterized protein n=1 Tax=Daphnia magna TaxID=35525 RepID=A0ABQ9ZHL5_9CRUS|nr:hypothetical protein OUZ56_021509 [Daphnia magna]
MSARFVGFMASRILRDESEDITVEESLSSSSSSSDVSSSESENEPPEAPPIITPLPVTRIGRQTRRPACVLPCGRTECYVYDPVCILFGRWQVDQWPGFTFLSEMTDS